MKNKGFVFVETIIVITILSVSLLVVYRAFNTSLMHEKNRLNYDAPNYLYRTYNIKSFLEDSSLSKYLSDLNQGVDIIIPVICSINFNSSNIELCEELLQTNTLGVENVYISKGNIKDIFKDDHEHERDILSNEMLNYIKTLSDEEDNILLVEYKENCERISDTDIESCDNNYTSLVIKRGA